MKGFVPGSLQNVRLSSKCMISGRMPGLLCIMAATTAGSNVIRIGITKSILDESKRLKHASAKPEQQKKIKTYFKAIKESFEPLGLIDPPTKAWSRSRLKHIEEEDKAAFLAVLQHGDDILLTPTPDLLPTWLKSLEVTVCTPREFLIAFSGPNTGNDPNHTKNVLKGVLWEHREATGLTDEGYNAWLCSERLEPLTKIIPPRG